MDSRA